MPVSEQKQSGSLQILVSQGGARLGSVSTSQAFSSEPSLQSLSPLQKRPRAIQLPSPQAKLFSGHSGSSVKSRGLTFFSLVLLSQFLTDAFQSQVCFSMSKAKPAGQRIACRPLKRALISTYQYSTVQYNYRVSHHYVIAFKNEFLNFGLRF